MTCSAGGIRRRARVRTAGTRRPTNLSIRRVRQDELGDGARRGFRRRIVFSAGPAQAGRGQNRSTMPTRSSRSTDFLHATTPPWFPYSVADGPSGQHGGAALPTRNLIIFLLTSGDFRRRGQASDRELFAAPTTYPSHSESEWRTHRSSPLAPLLPPAPASGRAPYGAPPLAPSCWQAVMARCRPRSPRFPWRVPS
jgi:hypothetical protein